MKAIKTLVLLLALGLSAYGQGVVVTANKLKGSDTAPSGTCGAQRIELTTAGAIWTCASGTWSSAGGGGTTINSTNGRLPYRVNSTTFGDSAISSNALSATGISVTSTTAGSGVTIAVTSSGGNEGITITPKGTSDLRVSNTGYERPLSLENSSGGGFISFFRSSTTIGGIGGNAMWLGSGSSTALAIGSVNAINFYTNNSTTQAMVLDTSNRLVIGTNGSADAQLSVYSQSTTRPSLKLQALSTTLGSQNVFESYNASGTLAVSLTSDGTFTVAGASSDINSGRNLRASATAAIYWNTRSLLLSPSDGVVTITNQAATDFTRLQLGGTTSAFGAVARDGAGIKIVGGDGTSVGWIKVPGVTVASLPAAATAGAGARSFVTDATATTFGSTVSGGGSNKVPVYSDGTNWIIG